MLAVRVGDDLGIGQLVLAAPGDQPDRAVRQRVLDPFGVAAVDQGDPIAVLGPEDQHRRAVDVAGRRPTWITMPVPGSRPATWTTTGLATARLNRAMRRPEARLLRRDGEPDLGWAEWAALIRRSYQGQPAVDGQHLSGDVAGVLGEQEDRRRRHLPGRALRGRAAPACGCARAGRPRRRGRAGCRSGPGRARWPGCRARAPSMATWRFSPMRPALEAS